MGLGHDWGGAGGPPIPSPLHLGSQLSLLSLRSPGLSPLGSRQALRQSLADGCPWPQGRGRSGREAGAGRGG
jgi:hypothetical protein